MVKMLIRRARLHNGTGKSKSSSYHEGYFGRRSNRVLRGVCLGSPNHTPRHVNMLPRACRNARRFFVTKHNYVDQFARHPLHTQHNRIGIVYAASASSNSFSSSPTKGRCLATEKGYSTDLRQRKRVIGGPV